MCKSLGVYCPIIGWSVQSKRLQATVLRKIRRRATGRRKSQTSKAVPDKDYELNATIPDISEEEFVR